MRLPTDRSAPAQSPPPSTPPLLWELPGFRAISTVEEAYRKSASPTGLSDERKRWRRPERDRNIEKAHRRRHPETTFNATQGVRSAQ